MRLIDADAVPKKVESVMDMQDLYLPSHFLEWVVDEMPTVVDIVRCKDCIYFQDDGDGYYSCNDVGFGVSPYDFCSSAERKMDEVKE